MNFKINCIFWRHQFSSIWWDWITYCIQLCPRTINNTCLCKTCNCLCLQNFTYWCLCRQNIVFYILSIQIEWNIFVCTSRRIFKLNQDCRVITCHFFVEVFNYIRCLIIVSHNKIKLWNIYCFLWNRKCVFVRKHNIWILVARSRDVKFVVSCIFHCRQISCCENWQNRECKTRTFNWIFYFFATFILWFCVERQCAFKNITAICYADFEIWFIYTQNIVLSVVLFVKNCCIVNSCIQCHTLWQNFKTLIVCRNRNFDASACKSCFHKSQIIKTSRCIRTSRQTIWFQFQIDCVTSFCYLHFFFIEIFNFVEHWNLNITWWYRLCNIQSHNFKTWICYCHVKVFKFAFNLQLIISFVYKTSFICWNRIWQFVRNHIISTCKQARHIFAAIINHRKWFHKLCNISKRNLTISVSIVCQFYCKWCFKFCYFSKCCAWRKSIVWQVFSRVFLQKFQTYFDVWANMCSCIICNYIYTSFKVV